MLVSMSWAGKHQLRHHAQKLSLPVCMLKALRRTADGLEQRDDIPLLVLEWVMDGAPPQRTPHWPRQGRC